MERYVLYIAKKLKTIDEWLMTKIFYDENMTIIDKKEWKMLALHRYSEFEMTDNVLLQEEFKNSNT